MTESGNAAQLRSVLKTRRLTQQQAAALVGMDRSQLNGYATGRLPIGAAAAEKLEAGLELPEGYFVRPASPRAATLAGLATRMDEALANQRAQWEELGRLGDDVKGIASDLTALTAYVRSVLEPPNSERERRLGGS